jgi:hypothetical protein
MAPATVSCRAACAIGGTIRPLGWAALICFLSFSHAREAPAERAPLAPDCDDGVEVDVWPQPGRGMGSS